MIPPTLPETQTYNHPCGDLLDGERRRDYLDICVPLYKASIRGDWEAAKEILKGHEYLVRYSITENKETTLHVAAMAQCTEYVERLLVMMDKEDLTLQNEEGNTAFCLAAMVGNTKMAEYMVEMNPEVLAIRGSGNMMPLYLAVADGKHDMANYLYDKSRDMPSFCWIDDDWSNIFLQCIQADLFDVALRILDDHEKSVFLHDERVGNMLRVLAQKPNVFMDKQPNTIVGILNSLTGLKVGPPLKDNNATQVLRKIWRNIVVKPKNKIDVILNGPFIGIAEKNTYPTQILFVAAETGNINFLVELIRDYPDLIWKRNNEGQTIFHIAVIHRHESIYNLLYEIGAMKDMVTRITDKNGNNMLHSFAMSAPINPREDVSGSALLMHYEFLWFKKVEAMIPPRYREAKNASGQKPFELFTENHKALASQGEKWVKSTISQSMVAAALISTIGFSVAFTIPGGYNQNNGFPIFLQNKAFMVFITLDAISFILSSISVLMYLSIMVSRYEQNDFLKPLPKKLVLGQLTLFLSIFILIVAFSANFFILYNNNKLPIVVGVLATIPVILFFQINYPNMKQSVRSAYGSWYLSRPKIRMLCYANPRF